MWKAKRAPGRHSGSVYLQRNRIKNVCLPRIVFCGDAATALDLDLAVALFQVAPHSSKDGFAAVGLVRDFELLDIAVHHVAK